MFVSYVGLCAISVFNQYAFNVIEVSMSLWGAKQLHEGVLKHVLLARPAFFDSTPVGL
jgi:hypothetical protein